MLMAQSPQAMFHYSPVNEKDKLEHGEELQFLVNATYTTEVEDKTSTAIPATTTEEIILEEKIEKSKYFGRKYYTVNAFITTEGWPVDGEKAKIWTRFQISSPDMLHPATQKTAQIINSSILKKPNEKEDDSNCAFRYRAAVVWWIVLQQLYCVICLACVNRKRKN
uniref:Uncharacterized protein n=1 Tax=Ditylenchus dipsaci TaxID=166011 RepID=A0A915EGL3_9BILA